MKHSTSFEILPLQKFDRFIHQKSSHRRRPPPAFRKNKTNGKNMNQHQSSWRHERNVPVVHHGLENDEILLYSKFGVFLLICLVCHIVSSASLRNLSQSSVCQALVELKSEGASDCNALQNLSFVFILLSVVSFFGFATSLIRINKIKKRVKYQVRDDNVDDIEMNEIQTLENTNEGETYDNINIEPNDTNNDVEDQVAVPVAAELDVLAADNEEPPLADIADEADLENHNDEDANVANETERNSPDNQYRNIVREALSSSTDPNEERLAEFLLQDGELLSRVFSQIEAAVQERTDLPVLETESNVLLRRQMPELHVQVDSPSPARVRQSPATSTEAMQSLRSQMSRQHSHLRYWENHSTPPSSRASPAPAHALSNANREPLCIFCGSDPCENWILRCGHEHCLRSLASSLTSEPYLCPRCSETISIDDERAIENYRSSSSASNV